MKIHLFALLLAFAIAAPAFADDWDGLSDAIGSRTSDAAAEDTDNDQSDSEGDSKDDEESKESTRIAKPVDLDQRAAEQKQYRATDPNRPGASGDVEGKRNVLGPLWGVPSGSPVMQNIDPEMEKQYAVNDDGRLVPKPDAEELEEQQREAQRAERQRQRETERAAKEQRWAREKAEREAEKDGQRQAKAQNSQQQPDTKQVEAAAQQSEHEVRESGDTDAEEEVDERRTISIGCRSGDDD